MKSMTHWDKNTRLQSKEQDLIERGQSNRNRLIQHTSGLGLEYYPIYYLATRASICLALPVSLEQCGGGLRWSLKHASWRNHPFIARVRNATLCFRGTLLHSSRLLRENKTLRNGPGKQSSWPCISDVQEHEKVMKCVSQQVLHIRQNFQI